MNTLFVLGNTVDPKDAMAVVVAEHIKKRLLQNQISIIHIDPTESLPDLPDYPIFLDTIHGINDVTIFNSLKEFIPPPRFSVHDFDLYTELSLLLKLKKIKGFTIIGVSEGGNVEDISKLVMLNLFKLPGVFDYHRTSGELGS